MIKNIMNEQINKFKDLITHKILLSEEYHNFADKRIFLGIPNTMNVISNISILIPALYLLTFKKRTIKSNLLIIHLVLLSIASSYYHINPSNQTLFWDILMIATTYIIVLIMFSNTKYGLLLYGYAILSILYWKYSNDLRLYLIILIGVLLYLILKYHKNKNLRNYLYIIVIMNILFRYSEHNDHEIYEFTNYQISGHTLKHIIAGIGIFYVIQLLQKVNKI